MKRCRFCGEEIQDAAIVCRHCRRDLVGPNVGNVTVARSASNWPWIVLTLAGLFTVLALTPVVPTMVAIVDELKSMTRRPDPPGQGVVPDGPNPAQAMLMTKTERDRGEALRDLVRSAGESCDRVPRIRLRDLDDNSNAFWFVACMNGNNFLVELKADKAGSTVVTRTAPF